MFDPSDDFLDVTDGLETVTVLRPGSPTTTTAHALRQAIAVREMEESEGQYTAGDVVWHLPAAEVEAPQPGGVILDGSGERWTVLEVRTTVRGSRWRCTTRDLAIAAGLDAYVDIEQAEYVKSEGGAEVATWNVWKSGLRARIQPIDSKVETADGRQVTVTRYTIYLAEPVAVDRTHRVRGPDGTLYSVVGYRKPSRIDALLEVLAERRE